MKGSSPQRTPLYTSAFVPTVSFKMGLRLESKSAIQTWFLSSDIGIIIIIIIAVNGTGTKPRGTSSLPSLPEMGSGDRGGVHPHHQPSERRPVHRWTGLVDVSY